MNDTFIPPHVYYREMVVPAIDSYRSDRDKLGRMLAACVSIYHLTDYIKASGHADVIAVLCADNPLPFNAVQTVASGAKHCIITRKNEHNPVRYHIEYNPPCFAGEMVLGLSFWGDTEGGYSIAAEEHTRVRILDCVNRLHDTFQRHYGNLLFPPTTVPETQTTPSQL